MATGGLYGTSTANSVVATSGAESTGLYGNGTQFGGSYFEWFIFEVSDAQPATPTGGSWSFTTNSGIPPAGWLGTPPENPNNIVWVSIAIVNSKNAASLTWSVPGKFSFSSGLPILSGTGSPLPGDGQSDQLYIQLDTTPQTIWFKETGTWTRLTGSSLYVDLTSNQTIAGTKTFSSPIAGSVTGTSANVTGIVAVVNGGTGVTTSTGTGSVVLNSSPLLNTPTLSGAIVDSTNPYVAFTPSAAPAYAEGRLFYDSTAKTLTYYNDNSQMSLNIGQENVVRVRNQTGSTITEGSVVYVNGATGNTPTVSLAIATAFSTADIIGVATTTILNNGFGYVTTAGLVNGLNTSAFTEGQAVFVSATTPGAFTATEPVAPNYSVQVGVILRANPSVGTLLVSLQMISTEVSHVVGTMLISQGGTGQTTANAAFNALVPSQTGNTGKYLTTDGSNTSWGTNPLGTVTSVAATVPDFLSISGSPITTSGTLTFGLSGTALPVLNGGTGTTTSTGSGSVVLDTSPTLVTPAIGTPTSGVVTNLTGTASININGTVGATTANSGAFTSITASADSSFNSTGAVKLSSGTTGERPAGVAGKLRFNTTTVEFEGYNGTAWASVGGSAISNDTSTATNLYPLFAAATTGTAASVYTSNAQYLFKPSTGELSVKAPRASNGILINSISVGSNYTIATGDNGLSAGPVSVASGVTVTISSGSVWTVV